MCQGDLERERETVRGLKATLAQQATAQLSLTAQLGALQAEKSAVQAEYERTAGSRADLALQLERAMKRCEELEREAPYRLVSASYSRYERDLIGGEALDPAQRARARTLFAKVLDAPGGGIRIQTIHGFCQGLLAAFPLEAGLVPGFRPLEAREEALLRRETLAELLVEAEDIRRTGSAALDLAYVACGRADAYFEAGVKPWDIAAGLLLVREAGGLVCDLQGRTDRLLDAGQIVAGNLKIGEQLQKTLVASGYAAAF